MSSDAVAGDPRRSRRSSALSGGCWPAPADACDYGTFQVSDSDDRSFQRLALVSVGFSRKTLDRPHSLETRLRHTLKSQRNFQRTLVLATATSRPRTAVEHATAIHMYTMRSHCVRASFSSAMPMSLYPTVDVVIAKK